MCTAPSLAPTPENTSAVSRHSFTLHFVEGGAAWAPDNWAQRAADMPWQPLYTDP